MSAQLRRADTPKHSCTRLTGILRTFGGAGEKCEKPVEFLHLRRHAIDSMRKLWNAGLGENLEDLGELEYQRSAPRPLLLNSVLHENLEDLRHPSPLTPPTLRNSIVNDLLGQCRCCPPPQGVRGNNRKRVSRFRRHFHQLFCLLRTANGRTLWDPVKRDLVHCDNLLGRRHVELPPPDPPSAAQARRESERGDGSRRRGHQCAAQPGPAAQVRGGPWPPPPPSPPPGFSSWKLGSGGWVGGGRVPNRRRKFHLAPPLPQPWHSSS